MNLAGTCVLVVDDEELVRTSTAMLLERRGAHVLQADSARAALEQAASFEGIIHVAVIDLIMPDTRGDVLLEELKAHHPSIRAVLCSGYEPDSATQAILNATGARFLSKPVLANDLWATVEELARS